MNFFQLILEGTKIAWGAILNNKVRAFLTMLGVATGIFAITSILTMVNSMKSSITQNLSALGNTTIFVHHWPWKDNSEDWFKYFNRPKVSYNDFMKLKLGLADVEGISYEVYVTGQTAKHVGRSVENVTVAGVTKDFGLIQNLEFYDGRYFSDIELQSGNPVCILGYSIADNLFEGMDPIGKTLRVGGKRLKVIGILKRKGQNPFGGSGVDEFVLIPYVYSPKAYNLNSRSVDKIITIKATSYDKMDYVESEAKGLIRAARGLKPKAEDNFSLNKQEMIMNMVDQFFGFMESAGWIISIFSLIIGVFSIGNIMYISVKERTHEIGIQKSLGATRIFILYQFLAESIVICILGGMIGLLATYALTGVVQVLINSSDIAMVIRVSGKDLIMAIALSAGIGVISGFIPALIGARMDPVIAIRSK
jgi:putative ABC transport system permease protein